MRLGPPQEIRSPASTVRALSCRDVSSGLESCMGARLQQWMKGPLTAMWGGSHDSALDQGQAPPSPQAPACARSPEQEKKDRKHSSRDPSGSSLYFPENWQENRKKSLMGRRTSARSVGLRRESGEGDTHSWDPALDNTRLQQSEQMATGLWQTLGPVKVRGR